MKSRASKTQAASSRAKRHAPHRQERQEASGDQAAATPASTKPQRTTRLLAAGLFGVLFFAYVVNGSYLPGNDAVPNVRLPIQLMAHQSLFFTPGQNPLMFEFQLKTVEPPQYTHFRAWNATYEGKTVLRLYQEGKLTLAEPKYYLTRAAKPGKYASTFGVGAGLTALPVFAAARVFVPSLEQETNLLWHLGKLVAAATVAGSAVYLFLAAAAYVPLLAAFLLAIAYGLGTCVWSTSSQALWQHGPCELFLAMGAYYLLRKERRHADALSGLAFGLAVLCRPTVLLVVASVLLFHAVTDRHRLLRFVLGGLPVAIAVLGYGHYAFGNPFTFGQLANGQIAQIKTGNPSLWQTPLYLGSAGLLLSPARGLLVYSPVALFSLWGMGRVFRDATWKDLRPLALAAVALFLLAAKWFDWWGGWCYGYRPIVDTSILLAFVALPVVERVRSSRALRAGFGVLLCWSVFVQAIGAFAYDVGGWNNGIVYDVTLPGTQERITFATKEQAMRHSRDHGSEVVQRLRNVDMPEYHHRLWSVTDSPIPYYVAGFSRAREARRIFIQRFLDDDG